jgi:hypothetical protein
LNIPLENYSVYQDSESKVRKHLAEVTHFEKSKLKQIKSLTIICNDIEKGKQQNGRFLIRFFFYELKKHSDMEAISKLRHD